MRGDQGDEGRTILLGIALFVALITPLAAQEPASPSAPAPPPTVRPDALGQLEARLRAMEEMNRKLGEELARTRREHADEMKQVLSKLDLLSASGTVARGGGAATSPGPIGAPTPNPPSEDELPSPAPDYYSFDFPQGRSDPRYRISNIDIPGKIPLEANFGPGFQLQTEDEEFRLQVHVLSQIEARVWGNPDQVPVNSGFFFPRQRFFLNGRITKPVEYVFSMNRGLGGTDLLDAFLNIRLSERFMIRFGRYMTPLTYDQFAIRPMWLPTPERSLFTTNLGLNRQIGLMAWGYLFDQKLDYAAGIFNGPRNSYDDFNQDKDFIGFLNARPFEDSERFWFLHYLNIGSSVAYGRQDQPPVPAAFRIGAVAPNADVPGTAAVPFLILNRNVAERGNRLLSSVHAAYYFRGLSLLGEWQYGYNSYATTGRQASVPIPVSGFYVTAAYFLTGEHIDNRTMVQPRRPLIRTRPGQARGWGAWELVSRVSGLGLDPKVFTSGFADRNLWSDSAVTTELGLNWYWNEYFKIYMFWLHGDFGDPVLYRPGRYQETADMFWLRMQLWF